MRNSLADRATSDLLIGPDWALNLEICDILKHDPGQARDFVKDLKKRIRSKNPKVQLLALTLLETTVKNCGDMVHVHITDKNIPHEMVKIVKKKPDFHVKEKILLLIDSWQEVFGGPKGRYPQFFMAYHDLLRAGIVFPKRAVKSTPLYSPTKIRASTLYPHTTKNHDKKTEKLEISSDSKFNVLSLTDIQNAREVMDVLVEMLNALELENKEDVKQEVIGELVEQCRLYRQRVVHLVNSTAEEQLLSEGLALNDNLHNVLSKYDAIATKTSKKPKKQKSLQALVDIDDDNNDVYPSSNSENPLQQLLLPAPEPSNMLTKSPRSIPNLDLLSGEEFGTNLIENSLALVPVAETTVPLAEKEQNMLVGYKYQENLAYLDGSHINYGDSTYKQDALWNDHIADKQQREGVGTTDQSSTLPPPPWEIELPESSHPLTLQQQQTGEIITYSPRIHRSQQMEMSPPLDQAYSYSQTIQGTQMASFNYGQHSESQPYGYNASYSYSNTNELSHDLYGLSIQDRYMNTGLSYQMPSSASYLQQPVKQFKAADNLFGDLVSMAKAKTNKPAN